MLGSWCVFVWRDLDMQLLAHFISGAICNFFFIPVLWFKPMPPRHRYAAIMGFGSCMVVLCCLSLLSAVACINPTADMSGMACHAGVAMYINAWQLTGNENLCTII